MDLRLEAPISKDIQDYLKSIGVFHYRSQVYRGKTKTGAFLHTGVKGLADLTCILKDCILFIETKKADGEQSTHQKAFMWRVRQLGHYYLIARSVDDVKEFFTEHNLEEK
jgi:hypothetical protein